MGKAALAALQRRLCQHDAAERRLLFYAAGYVRRAGRQHRAAPRREIPRAAAAQRRRRWRPRLLSVASDPALGIGAQELSLGLSRSPEAVARGRAPDPAARDAALAGALLLRDLP